MRRNVAAPCILYAEDRDRIAGYYTLSATGIQAADLSDEMIRRLPRYPTLPAVLLGRLAVDLDYQGHGLGEMLLLTALERALTHNDQIAALAMVVDAKDDAAERFYARYGFHRLTDSPRRLFLPMQTIAHLLSEEG